MISHESYNNNSNNKQTTVQLYFVSRDKRHFEIALVESGYSLLFSRIQLTFFLFFHYLTFAIIYVIYKKEKKPTWKMIKNCHVKLHYVLL